MYSTPTLPEFMTDLRQVGRNLVTDFMVWREKRCGGTQRRRVWRIWASLMVQGKGTRSLIIVKERICVEGVQFFFLNGINFVLGAKLGFPHFHKWFNRIMLPPTIMVQWWMKDDRKHQSSHQLPAWWVWFVVVVWGKRRFLTSDFASGVSKSSIRHKAKVYMNNELKKHATTSDSKRSKSKSNLNPQNPSKSYNLESRREPGLPVALMWARSQ